MEDRNVHDYINRLNELEYSREQAFGSYKNKDNNRSSKPYGMRRTNNGLQEVRNSSISGTQQRTRRQINRKFIEENIKEEIDIKGYKTPINESNRYGQFADCKENMSSIEPKRMHLIYPSHNTSERLCNKPINYADLRKSDRVASGNEVYRKPELKIQNTTPDYNQKKTFSNEYKNEISRTKSCKQAPASYMQDRLEQTDEFDQINEEVDHNTLNNYLSKNSISAKYLPASLIRKTKSPFTADHSICQEHHQPYRYICLVHSDDSEKWCEECSPPPSCIVIDMKKHAEKLKNACQIESLFFNGNTESNLFDETNLQFNCDLNKYEDNNPFEKATNIKPETQSEFMNEVYPRFECKCGNSIDKQENLAKFLHEEADLKCTFCVYFNSIYEKLGRFHSELKNKNKLSSKNPKGMKEIMMMEQMVNKARVDCNLELNTRNLNSIDKNLPAAMESLEVLKEYIGLVEEERINVVLNGVDTLEKQITTKINECIKEISPSAY